MEREGGQPRPNCLTRPAESIGGKPASQLHPHLQPWSRPIPARPASFEYFTYTRIFNPHNCPGTSLSYRRETWGTETSRHQPWGTAGSQQKQDLVQATKVQSPCFYHHTSCPTGIAQPSGWGRGRSVHHRIPCMEHCDLHLIGPRQTPVEGMRNEGMNL